MTGWTHWNLVVSEEGRGIPGLDIWDNLAPHITLESVLSQASHPESGASGGEGFCSKNSN